MRSIGLLLGATALAGCGSSPNLFTVEDDVELGMQLKDEIQSNPEEFPTLDPDEYSEAYTHIRDLRDAILESDDVRYTERFSWEIRLIDDDETLNAFAAPGGYIWVYTGLIRFLDVEDHLAGVMAHEIAHADRRHSTQQLTKQYGLSALVTLVLGQDPGLLAEVAAGLVTLSFSRADETEADSFSVRYLCDTNYAADGAAGFFRQIEGAGVPPFLSTHPSPDNRVENIEALADELGCSTELNPDADYQDLLDSLPPPSDR